MSGFLINDKTFGYYLSSFNYKTFNYFSIGTVKNKIIKRFVSGKFVYLCTNTKEIVSVQCKYNIKKYLDTRTLNLSCFCVLLKFHDKTLFEQNRHYNQFQILISVKYTESEKTTNFNISFIQRVQKVSNKFIISDCQYILVNSLDRSKTFFLLLVVDLITLPFQL